VPYEEVADFVERHQIFHTLETSAKENINVEETFIAVARVR
jgi:hypothetical protein